MTRATEMFRFMALRQPETTPAAALADGLIRDARPAGPRSLLRELTTATGFPARLAAAAAFRDSADFVATDDPVLRAAGRVARTLREDFSKKAAGGAPDGLESDLAGIEGRLWDSLYALVVIGMNEATRTNPVADALRVLHVLRTIGDGGTGAARFDDLELVIRPLRDAPPKPVRRTTTGARRGSTGDDGTAAVAKDLADVEDFLKQLNGVRQRGQVRPGRRAGADTMRRPVALDETARKALSGHAALRGQDIDLENATVDALVRTFSRRRAQLRALALKAEADERKRENEAAGETQTFISAFSSAPPVSVPKLEVGAVSPPVVGDLLMSEQELLRYELGEIADIQNIMKGEQRERTTRSLTRRTQSRLFERESEEERSTSKSSDDRFQLSTEAQTQAQNNLSISAGASVSGTYGPVTATVNANASFSSSRSESNRMAEEVARNVTETASERIRSAIRESETSTLMTETESTTLQGFSNVDGKAHVSGVYCWVDRVYAARTVNYGRRMMLEFMVPEPAAGYRALLEGAGDEAEDLPPLPRHPADLRVSLLGNVLPDEEAPSLGYKAIGGPDDITELTYLPLAAHYDVTNVQPPPPEWVAKAVPLTHPATGQAAEVKDHTAASKELSLVDGNTTLQIDPDYRLRTLGVFAAEGSAGGLAMLADTLLLGTRDNDTNRIMVQIGTESFYLSVDRKKGASSRRISSNLNKMKALKAEDDLAKSRIDSVPVVLSADFEGLAALTVLYTAERSEDAYRRWQIETYGMLVQGYERKRRAYDDALRARAAPPGAAPAGGTPTRRDSEYRAIERTELKRGCVDLLSLGTAFGYGSVVVVDGIAEIAYAPLAGSDTWRHPIANGAIADFFEGAFEWDKITYAFHPYFWTSRDRWADLAGIEGEDPVFSRFLQAGMAKVIVPIAPGNERAVMSFLTTGRIWSGGYLPLFDDPDTLDMFEDVERARRLDPPLQVGEPWEIRLPSKLVQIRKEDGLPEFGVEWWPE